MDSKTGTVFGITERVGQYPSTYQITFRMSDIVGVPECVVLVLDHGGCMGYLSLSSIQHEAKIEDGIYYCIDTKWVRQYPIYKKYDGPPAHVSYRIPTIPIEMKYNNIDAIQSAINIRYEIYQLLLSSDSSDPWPTVLHGIISLSTLQNVKADLVTFWATFRMLQLWCSVTESNEIVSDGLVRWKQMEMELFAMRVRYCDSKTLLLEDLPQIRFVSKNMIDKQLYDRLFTLYNGIGCEEFMIVPVGSIGFPWNNINTKRFIIDQGSMYVGQSATYLFAMSHYSYVLDGLTRQIIRGEIVKEVSKVVLDKADIRWNKLLLSSKSIVIEHSVDDWKQYHSNLKGSKLPHDKFNYNHYWNAVSKHGATTLRIPSIKGRNGVLGYVLPKDKGIIDSPRYFLEPKPPHLIKIDERRTEFRSWLKRIREMNRLWRYRLWKPKEKDTVITEWNTAKTNYLTARTFWVDHRYPDYMTIPFDIKSYSSKHKEIWKP